MCGISCYYIVVVFFFCIAYVVFFFFVLFVSYYYVACGSVCGGGGISYVDRVVVLCLCFARVFILVVGSARVVFLLCVYYMGAGRHYMCCFSRISLFLFCYCRIVLIVFC